ncbi:MAG: protein kinase domain-containing protein [Pyrinomonadaceae bacterium]
MIGQTVSHYRILEPLGEGGMGTVYLAEDTHLGRRVAIKFPSIDSDSHDFRARFLREARAISELSHPRIATLFDYGHTDEGRPFLVMELAKGRTLAELIRKGELSLTRAVQIVADVAEALTEAHAQGLVHRDIKPSNIVIDDRGQVKVLDFGLAKQLANSSASGSQAEAPTLLTTATRSGVVLGTPAYLSPEQARGQAVDGRSDLFALGVVLYESITGHTPFTGEGFIDIAANVLHVNPPPPSQANTGVPRQLDFVTLKALEKRAEKRYQSAAELIADLKAVSGVLGEEPAQTMIKKTAGSSVPSHGHTLGNLSQILQRPRIPISYVLIVVMIALVAAVAAMRWWRPRAYQPSAAAQKWYEVGTGALRDGAYYQATKAFEQAIASDDGYMLAHARLAEALVELDATDRAKDELLRVSSADKSALSDPDSLQLEATIANARRDYTKATKLYEQILRDSPEAEKAFVLVDLGRAYDKSNEVAKAVHSFVEASTRNPQYATAFLQLGVLQGRQQELDGALASLDKAESIYQALGNLEGRTEAVFQRGALFNKLNKLAEAKAQLEQALNLARANNNQYQTIKTLLQLSSVTADSGGMTRATEHAREAVDLAQKNGMENLSALGLIDLGNTFLIRGDYAEADKYLMQALETAQRGKARRTEARARVSLASLKYRQNDPAEMVSYLQPALEFYQQGAYRSETSSCLALLARANRQKGDYDAALKGVEQLLQLAQEANDQPQIALGHTELASVLVLQEKFAAALDHFKQAHAIYKSQGVERSIAYNLQSRGNVLWKLGRYQDAQALLDEARTIVDKPGGGYKSLSIEIDLIAADMALSQNQFSNARSRAEKVLLLAGDQFLGSAAGAKRVLGLSRALEVQRRQANSSPSKRWRLLAVSMTQPN